MSRNKDKMTKYIYYTYYDTDSFERKLEQLALEGWLLENIGFTCTFRRIEPKKLHYSVIFTPQAPDYTPTPSEDELDFRDMCEHTGWKLAVQVGKLSVYFNESDDPVPIETEPEIKFNHIHSTFMRSRFLVSIMFVVMAFFHIGIRFLLFRDRLAQRLSSPLDLSSVAIYLMMAVLSIFILVQHLVWYRRAKRAVDSGLDVPQLKNANKINRIFLIVFLFVFLLILLLGFNVSAGAFILVLAAVFGASIVGVNYLFRRLKVSKKAYYIGTLVCSIILTFTMSAAAGTYVIFNIDSLVPEYSADELILTTQDVFGMESDEYNCSVDMQSTFILGRYEGRQSAGYGSYSRKDFSAYLENPVGHYVWSYPEIEYTIYDVKLPLLYNLCLNEIKAEALRYADVEQELAISAQPWGANEAYFVEDYLLQKYILCYDDFLVLLEIYPGAYYIDGVEYDELTEAHMAQIGRILTEKFGR